MLASTPALEGADGTAEAERATAAAGGEAEGPNGAGAGAICPAFCGGAENWPGPRAPEPMPGGICICWRGDAIPPGMPPWNPPMLVGGGMPCGGGMPGGGGMPCGGGNEEGGGSWPSGGSCGIGEGALSAPLPGGSGCC